MSKSYGSYRKPKNIYGELVIRRDLKLKTGTAVVGGDSVDPIFYSSVRNRAITSLDGVEVVVMETPSVKEDALLDGRIRRYSTVSVYIARYNDATQAEAASCLSEIKEMYPQVISGSTITDSLQYKSTIGDTVNTSIYGGFVDATQYSIVVGTPSYTTPIEDRAALDSPRDGNTYGRQDGEWVQVTGGEGGGAVDSVFGRTGVVAAESGDYTATQITNNSGTAGASVGAALTSLQTAVNGKATAAQGALADSAIQPADLASVATSGQYSDLGGTPTLGTAAATSSADYATASQGVAADSAVQPGDNITTLTNNANYITSAQAPVQTVAGRSGAVVLSTSDLTDFNDSDYVSSTNLASASVSQGATLVGVHDSSGHYASTNVEGALAEIAVELDSLQGVNFFAPARVHTVSNITLSGISTIDGVSISQGDRILVEEQTNPVENGIYIASSGAWTRATDADAAGDFILNKTCYVEEGDVGAGKTYALTAVPTTLGTDAVAWTEKFQINNSVGAGSIGTTELATNAVTYNKLDAELQADIDKTELITVTGPVNLDSGFATAAQGATADTAVQPGDNVSALTNDSGFITSASAPVQSVSGRTGAVTLTSADVGLGNADNTADVDKPVSTAQQVALNSKANTASPVFTGTPTAPTPAADDNSNKLATTAYVQTEIAGISGGGGFEVKPVVTPVDPPAVDQGVTTTATQTADAGWPGLVWYFYDYTGTPGSFNRSSSSGIVGVQENTPGTYTMKVRAAWPFGISDAQTINIVVNAFTLTQDTMFGGIDGLRLSANLSSSSSWSNNWLPVQGAVAYDSGAYTFDVGSIEADTANCIAFYDYVADQLLAFKYNSGGTIDGVYEWTGVTALPAQGSTLGNSFTQFMSDSGQKAAATSSVIAGKKAAVSGGYYHAGLGSSHYLEITPSGTEFNNFGASSTDWSYGFVLADDWMADGSFSQMLAPTGADYFINGITGYGIGASPYEYVVYGNSTSGPYTTSSNGATWNIQTNGWKIGEAGDLVVVTYDGTGTDTWKLYVEGTLIWSSSNHYLYMSSSTTPTALRLGDFTDANGITSYPTAYEDLTGWYARLDSIFVANGTAFSQAQVTELTADKADLSLSDNYASITTLAEFDGTGVTNVKGGASYSRGDISFT